MTVHTQDGIISFCLHRNNPVHEITRNAIIIELDTKWKTTEFLASSANCLPPPSQLSAPCFFEATYWTLVTDSDLKINKLKNNQLQRLPEIERVFICTAASRPNPWHQKDFILPGLNPQFEISPAVAMTPLAQSSSAGSWLSPLAGGAPVKSPLSAVGPTSNPETWRQHVSFVASFL